MAKYLVIVESPAKVKTIKKFLGKNYEVMASNGHVRDLPKSQLGFSPENNFEPKYITIRGKGEILAKLRKEVKKADKIYLATDPDREGEAISWHLTKALKLEDKDVSRISFNEITKTAVKASLKNPREIDMDLVDAQQARRMLDRMVGYRISPLLWAKVKRGLSAGRVQSVALRIVCDREAEIDAFIPEEYWSLEASLLPEGEKKPILAKLTDKDGKKIEVTSEAEMNAILEEIKGQSFQVKDIKEASAPRKHRFRLQRVRCSRRRQKHSISRSLRRCVLPSSCTKVWISRDREPSVLSHTCVRILSAFPRKRMLLQESLSEQITESSIFLQEREAGKTVRRFRMRMRQSVRRISTVSLPISRIRSAEISSACIS